MLNILKRFRSNTTPAYIAVGEVRFASLADEYKKLDLMYRNSASVAKSYKSKMNTITEEMGKFVIGKRASCNGVSLCRVAPAARVDYKRIYADLCKLHPEIMKSIDTNSYTSNVSDYWRVSISEDVL